MIARGGDLAIATAFEILTGVNLEERETAEAAH